MNYEAIKNLLPAPSFGMGIDLNENGPPAQRFAAVSEENLEDLLKKKNSPKTDESTGFALNILKKYCEESGLVVPESPAEFNLFLCRFYAALRTKKGDYYKLNSMNSIRFSLQRHFKEKKKVDIIEDNIFVEANTTFRNILQKIKAAGKGDTVHYAEVEPEDLIRLNEGFDPYNPTGLQHLVWFNIMYYLIRRGRENMRAMTKTSFRVSKDASGKHFIYQSVGESDKNHSIDDGPSETTGEGRIYATDGPKCPVACFVKYINALNPHIDDLWQKPRSKISICENIWYCNVPLGEKYLGNMMAMFTQQYKLSQRYTNHCLRVTSLQVLDDLNVDSRHIIRVSGHKNTDSITNYARRLSTARKRKISSLLTSSVVEQQDENIPSTSTSTISSNSNKIVNVTNNENIPSTSTSTISSNSNKIVNVTNNSIDIDTEYK